MVREGRWGSECAAAVRSIAILIWFTVRSRRARRTRPDCMATAKATAEALPLRKAQGQNDSRKVQLQRQRQQQIPTGDNRRTGNSNSRSLRDDKQRNK